jgi:hypothetical protein
MAGERAHPSLKEAVVSILRVLSEAGDTAVAWESAEVAAGDAEAVAAVREAERIFAEQRARGAAAASVHPGQPATRIDSFDPQADLIVIMPRVIGG